MTQTSQIPTSAEPVLKMLNVGCGDSSHPAWTNLDLRGSGGAKSGDVTEGLPFPDASFDVVYHSHLLEHLPLEKAPFFMRECNRVLKAGGVIRVLVPDLEQAAKLYLAKLETAPAAPDEYDWMMLELYDQCVRQQSGGRMEAILRRLGAHSSTFVAQRMGSEGELYWGPERHQVRTSLNLSANLSRWIWRVRTACAAWAVFLLAGAKGKSAFETGLFRASGEVHHWMYDRFSLARLMTEAGLREVRVASPLESRIPGFSHFGLDQVNGAVRKPHSLVMEGVKP